MVQHSADTDATGRDLSPPRQRVRMAPVTLQGDRVTLRRLRPRDRREWLRVGFRNAQHLNRWMLNPKDFSLGRAAFAWRCGRTSRQRRRGHAYRFGVFDMIGFCGEVHLSGVRRGLDQSCHISYWIDRRRGGRGYGTEAVSLVLGFAFGPARLHRVTFEILPRNQRSIAVARSVGARREGTAKRMLYKDGAWRDYEIFAVTAEDLALTGHARTKRTEHPPSVL